MSKAADVSLPVVRLLARIGSVPVEIRITKEVDAIGRGWCSSTTASTPSPTAQVATSSN
jgi:hypothetical protein